MYIPDKKRQIIIGQITTKCGCGTGCDKCFNNINIANKLADSNIPVAYWFKGMDKFEGAKNVQETTSQYIKDIDSNFVSGKNICYSGTLGTGKTYSACCILKNAIIKGYDVYYTTLADLVAYSVDFEFKSVFVYKTNKVDFLCIDEVDARHLGESNQSIDFYGRILEKLLRYRIQNNLPMIIATNNSGLDDVFSGQFKKIFESLAKKSINVVPALGKDYRLGKGKNVN